jgi:hypothetical protein
LRIQLTSEFFPKKPAARVSSSRSKSSSTWSIASSEPIDVEESSESSFFLGGFPLLDLICQMANSQSLNSELSIEKIQVSGEARGLHSTLTYLQCLFDLSSCGKVDLGF